MTKLSEAQVAVLERMAKGDRIERGAISRRPLFVGIDGPYVRHSTLTALTQAGFLHRYGGTWNITALGRAALEKHRALESRSKR